MTGALFLALVGVSPAGAQVPVKPVPDRSKGAIVLARTKPRWRPGGTVLLPGMNVRGQLTPTDPVLSSDKTPYQIWTYAGRAGEVLTVTMRSTSLDSYLLIARQTAEGVETIGEDDDGLGAGTSDAGLRVRLPSDGEYLIIANAAASRGPQYFYGVYALELVSSIGSTVASNWNALYPGGGSPSEGYAVVVGISDYPGEDQDLTGPRQDAAMFRQVLIGRYGFKPERIVTLTDRNGNRDQIINAFRRFLSQAGPKGTAVFYFSGAGTELDESVGLTNSGEAENNEHDDALYVWGNAPGEKGSLILQDELDILAGELNAGRVLMVLDASYSGVGTRGDSPRGLPKLARFRDVKDRLALPARFLNGPGRESSLPITHITLNASSDKEVAWTATGWPDRGGLASVFTYFLVNAMAKAPVGTTISAMMTVAGGQTNDFARSNFGRTQTPRAKGERVGDLLVDYLGQ